MPYTPLLVIRMGMANNPCILCTNEDIRDLFSRVYNGKLLFYPILVIMMKSKICTNEPTSLCTLKFEVYML